LLSTTEPQELVKVTVEFTKRLSRRLQREIRDESESRFGTFRITQNALFTNVHKSARLTVRQAIWKLTRE
jgi:hypothetical protein